jgi:hypothetical protein
MPQCRVCKEKIDKTKDDWIMPSKNYYYHKSCYKSWKKAEFSNEYRVFRLSEALEFDAIS